MNTLPFVSSAVGASNKHFNDFRLHGDYTRNRCRRTRCSKACFRKVSWVYGLSSWVSQISPTSFQLKGFSILFWRPEELPPRSPVQVVQEAGCGLGVGLLIGYVFKSVGQIAISTVGGGLVSLSGKLSPVICRTCQSWTRECFFSVLQQLGYVKVDWKRLEADYNKLKCRNPNMSLENIRYTELMKENVPFTGGVAGGFFLALGWTVEN